MKVPTFWASRHGEVIDLKGRRFPLRVWGWSFASAAEAAALAGERLRQAVELARTGAPLGHYYPRLPLREETIDVLVVDGEDVATVTRNRYGSLVLNTERVLVADVDRDLHLPKAHRRRLQRLWSAAPTGPTPEQVEVEAIRRWAARHPDLGVRTYRTAAGLRVLVTGADAPPGSDRSTQILEDLGSDDLYVRLCVEHRTYRARLTPKPWRVGAGLPRDHWPFEPPDDARRFAQWLERYEAARAGWATCRLVALQGPVPHPQSAEGRIVALHDEISQAGVTADLA